MDIVQLDDKISKGSTTNPVEPREQPEASWESAAETRPSSVAMAARLSVIFDSSSAVIPEHGIEFLLINGRQNSSAIDVFPIPPGPQRVNTLSEGTSGFVAEFLFLLRWKGMIAEYETRRPLCQKRYHLVVMGCCLQGSTGSSLSI